LNSLGESRVPGDLFDFAEQLLELFLGDLQVVVEQSSFVLACVGVFVDQVDDEAQVSELRDVEVLLFGPRHGVLVQVLGVFEDALARLESRSRDDAVVEAADRIALYEECRDDGCAAHLEHDLAFHGELLDLRDGVQRADSFEFFCDSADSMVVEFFIVQ